MSQCLTPTRATLGQVSKCFAKLELKSLWGFSKTRLNSSCHPTFTKCSECFNPNP
ncbi:hypothetical protein D3C76_1834540 [compost metagenome]